MVEVREATEPESQSWLDGWRDRLLAWFGDFSHEPEWVSKTVETSLTRWSNATPRHVFTLTDGDEPVGQLALAEVTDPPAVRLVDLWVRPELSPKGPRPRGAGLGAAMGATARRSADRDRARR